MLEVCVSYFKHILLFEQASRRTGQIVTMLNETSLQENV